MNRMNGFTETLAPYAARYRCPADDGRALVEMLPDHIAARPGRWERERTVADLGLPSDGGLRGAGVNQVTESRDEGGQADLELVVGSDSRQDVGVLHEERGDGPVA
jgi:hypothetical protein